MSTTRDAVGLVGSVLKSLLSLITGEEEKQPTKDSRPDWQTAEDRVRADQRRRLLERRLERIDKSVQMHNPPAQDHDHIPDDAA